uniref:Uncharacterized protein n=1 Tax=Anguilla anguilla TaxID=7936 RepID=A0A0E9WXA1_ANGAN
MRTRATYSLVSVQIVRGMARSEATHNTATITTNHPPPRYPGPNALCQHDRASFCVQREREIKAAFGDGVSDSSLILFQIEFQKLFFCPQSEQIIDLGQGSTDP